MPELKLCPHCLGANIYVRGHSSCQVTCRACRMEGPEPGGEYTAITAWNSLPRALTWTTDPPKVPGWYWRKETAKDRTHVFHFTGNWEDYGEHWESDRVCPLPLKLNGNLWAGPIDAPLELEES